jgi:outer membrane protein assembly factor BamB
MRRRSLRLVCTLLVLGGVAAGCATTTVRGRVFADRNGDGAQQDDEPGVAGVVVALDRDWFVRTRDDGSFSITVPDEGRVVWARVPDGFRPGPVWARAGLDVRLGLVPLSAEEIASPLTFVVASDSHATTSTGPWNGGDLRDAIDQAISLPTRPRFFTIVGDVTQGAEVSGFERVQAALAGVPVPWIPVAGGHDWYDGGRAWHSVWGPPSYSFDVGYLHVVVWDTNLPEDEQIRFFENELAHVDRAAIVIGLGHESPPTQVADALAALGVDYLFTGHWHSNRRVEHLGMVEWGTQTLVMGTIDQSPSGYRVITFAGDVPIVEHRARLVEPQLAMTSPHAGSCASPDGFELLVTAALDAATPDVIARIDCGPALRLAPRGTSGWSFAHAVGPLAPGTHSVDLRAVAPSGRRIEKQLAFEVCTPPVASQTIAAASQPGEWPQHGGGPDHAGATALPIAPPLHQAWATAIGGNVLLGTPVVADRTVVVASWDLGAGNRGGLVALDLATGAEKWRYTTPFQARSTPAISGDTVVVATNNGEVHAVALADGSPRWIHDAAEGLERLAASLWGAPAIAEGVVYVAVQGRMSALDLATGEPLWTRDIANVYPWLGSLAAVTVVDGTAVATYGRDDGMTAWNAITGAARWEDRSGATVAVNATPVAGDGLLYVINSSGLVTAYDLQFASRRWSRVVTPDSNDWMYSVTATPVLADGRLFVPTQWQDLVALDAATGAELWRVPGPGGTINLAHYRDAEPGYPASPVATGDILWVPRLDGTLAALAVADGRELWSTQLGAPIISAPAPAGEYLVVATYDGTVRALVPGTPVPPQPVAACPPLEEPPAPETEPVASGCCAIGGGGPHALVLAALVGLMLNRRRRDRSFS